MPNPLQLLRLVAFLEAISWPVLISVSLTVDRVNNRMPIRVFGMIHGVLFLVLVWLLIRARFEAQWPKGRVWLLFVASLVPFWPFFLDRRFPGWIAQTKLP